jgi:hypothetical protein
MIGSEPINAQSGGSGRGYQGIAALLAISTTDEQ